MTDQLHWNLPSRLAMDIQQSADGFVGQNDTSVTIEHNDSGAHGCNDRLYATFITLKLFHLSSETSRHGIQRRSHDREIPVSNNRQFDIQVPDRERVRCLR